MDERRTTEQVAEVVRAHRFELLDNKDRLRATLEAGTGGEGQIEAGLRIFDCHGSERIIVAQMSWGALVSIAHAGETVAFIECADDIDANFAPGVQIALCDGSSNPKLRWVVSLEGEVVEEVRGEVPGPEA